MDHVFEVGSEDHNTALDASAKATTTAKEADNTMDEGLAEALEEICLHDADNLSDVKEIRDKLKFSQLLKVDALRQAARKEKETKVRIGHARKKAKRHILAEKARAKKKKRP